eukprot:TRINITY_DN3427_c0_g1_i1.p1 TRINITY_DN3427_c0_g1~~TRINITY_DN3427_c0_g1_i1.p1  ORF type:complete len:298 (-),score=62.55 TRINITY_DN3427_c0_g1_i1:84-941(-)
MARPEHQKPPELYYDDTEAKKYARSTRMQDIQVKLSERALELLALPQGASKLILDIGCGTGISGTILEKDGHFWVGTDISEAMLKVGKQQQVNHSSDTFCHDMGTGVPFRSGVFDGVISISALQWLCNADTSTCNPIKRINKFFNTLYASLIRGSRAVFQFYPENTQQVELLTSAAIRAGFTGGLLIDYPNSAKAKKYFLVLFAGMLPGQAMPKPLGTDEALPDPTTVDFVGERERRVKGKSKKSKRIPVKSREWILNKKERQRRQGKDTRPDTAYTGRKRKPRF